MTPDFWPFSDALMAALASRSHEWLQWEIRECVEEEYGLRGKAEYPSKTLPFEHKQTQVTVTLSLPSSTPGQMGYARLACDPNKDSPSETITQLLRKAAAHEQPAFALPDWRANVATRQRIETELVNDPELYLAKAHSELSQEALGLEWELVGLVRSTQVKNSRGHVATYRETEITAKKGASVIFSGPRLLIDELAKAFRQTSI